MRRSGIPSRVIVRMEFSGRTGIVHQIAELEFEGYMAHEFIPTREPLAALREAIAVCNV